MREWSLVKVYFGMGWVDIFMGAWGWLGWVEVCFGWVEVSGQFLSVVRDKWGWLEVYFGCVGVSGQFLWVDWDG